jgi:hypothetical protein
MIDIHTFKRWCNHCRNAADFETHHENCEFTGLKKEVEKLRVENFRMREILMASYAPRAWEEE